MTDLPHHSVEEDDPIFQDQGCLDAPLQDESPEAQSESDDSDDDEDAAFPS